MKSAETVETQATIIVMTVTKLVEMAVHRHAPLSQVFNALVARLMGQTLALNCVVMARTTVLWNVMMETC